MKSLFAGFLGTLVLLTFAAADTGDLAPEKADFVIKLIDYVTWPDDAGTDSNGTVVIKVVGTTPISPELEKLATGAEKKISVKRVGLTDDLANCQILLISTCELSDLATVMKQVEGKPILTVGDCVDFARYGVMVNFYTEEDGDEEKVKFEVNQVTPSDACLKISSKMLKLARHI